MFPLLPEEYPLLNRDAPNSAMADLNAVSYIEPPEKMRALQEAADWFSDPGCQWRRVCAAHAGNAPHGRIGSAAPRAMAARPILFLSF
jgi:hypothetical protein